MRHVRHESAGRAMCVAITESGGEFRATAVICSVGAHIESRSVHRAAKQVHHELGKWCLTRARRALAWGDRVFVFLERRGRTSASSCCTRRARAVLVAILVEAACRLQPAQQERMTQHVARHDTPADDLGARPDTAFEILAPRDGRRRP